MLRVSHTICLTKWAPKIPHTTCRFYTPNINPHAGSHGSHKRKLASFHQEKTKEIWYNEALENFQKQAERGNDPSARLSIGNMYRLGMGYERDIDKAIKWYKRDAGRGDAVVQFDIGTMYLEKLEYREALDWFFQSAYQHHPDANFMLGNMYRLGLGCIKDLEMAHYYYKKSAELGNTTARYLIAKEQEMPWTERELTDTLAKTQFLIGEIYELGITGTVDMDAAHDCYKKSAEHGNAYSQYKLGSLFYHSTKEGEEWLKKSAKQGHPQAQDSLGEVGRIRLRAEEGDPEAQLRLGHIFSDGKIVARDFRASVDWYQKSAEQGNSDAQFYLGAAYLRDRGYGIDTKLALEWLTKSAEQEHPLALCELGIYYMTNLSKGGQGGQSGLRWLKRSAALNCGKAMFYIGHMYQFGVGVKRDEMEALKWYKLAQNQPGPKAVIAKIRVKSLQKGEPEARALARTKAREQALAKMLDLQTEFPEGELTHIFLDASNIMYVPKPLQNILYPRGSKQVEHIIGIFTRQFLKAFSRPVGEAVVVFDYTQVRHEETVGTTKYRLFAASPFKTTDDAIVQRLIDLQGTPGIKLCITSDKELSVRIKEKGGAVMQSHRFLELAASCISGSPVSDIDTWMSGWLEALPTRRLLPETVVVEEANVKEPETEQELEQAQERALELEREQELEPQARETEQELEQEREIEQREQEQAQELEQLEQEQHEQEQAQEREQEQKRLEEREQEQERKQEQEQEKEQELERERVREQEQVQELEQVQEQEKKKRSRRKPARRRKNDE